MSGSQLIVPPFDDTLSPSIHFHHISKDDSATPLRELGMHEAYTVSNFELAEGWRAVQLGADVDELPIRFCDRVQGQSKLGWPSIAEALTEVPQMYLLSLGSR